MKISIDTKEDSHEELRNVIKMLQNLVGDSQEVFTNQPAQEASSPMDNIFGDTSQPAAAPETPTEAQAVPTADAETTDQSTEDLFAELFSEEEIKKMEPTPKEEEEELPKSKKKNYSIEFY